MTKTSHDKLIPKDLETRLADLRVPIHGVTLTGPELAELFALRGPEVLKVLEEMGEAVCKELTRRKLQQSNQKRRPKAPPASKDDGAPYLDTLGNGSSVIFAPVPGSSMGRLMHPERDAVDARKEVAKYAKRTKRDAAWVRAKEIELGLVK